MIPKSPPTREALVRWLRANFKKTGEHDETMLDRLVEEAERDLGSTPRLEDLLRALAEALDNPRVAVGKRARTVYCHVRRIDRRGNAA